MLLNGAGSTASETYNMTSIGISWPGEANKYGVTQYNYTTCVPPPFWAERYPNGYTAEGATAIPVLSLDEHFQVWMRTAGLPTFRKLYFRNDKETMASGMYEISILMSTSLPFVAVRLTQAQITPSPRLAAPSRSCSPPCP